MYFQRRKRIRPRDEKQNVKGSPIDTRSCNHVVFRNIALWTSRVSRSTRARHLCIQAGLGLPLHLAKTPGPGPRLLLLYCG